jgi:hypothetical protein
MKVVYQFPPDCIEGEVVCIDATGKPVPISRIEYKPYFHKATKIVPVLYASVLDSTGAVISRGALQLSSLLGNLRFKDRTETCKPEYEQQKDKAETKADK